MAPSDIKIVKKPKTKVILTIINPNTNENISEKLKLEEEEGN
jgi:hypothetical protein